MLEMIFQASLFADFSTNHLTDSNKTIHHYNTKT